MQIFSEILQYGTMQPNSKVGWSDFLFDLGCQIASKEVRGKSCNAILVVPVIAMSAPLIALGYLYTKFKYQTHHALGIDFFRKLPHGSSLIFRSKDGPMHAVFEGIREITPDRAVDPEYKIECVAVRFQSHKKGNCTELLMPGQMDKVTVVSSNQGVDERNLGKNAVGMGKFAQLVFGRSTDMSGVLNSVCIVGKVAELKWELTGVPLLSGGKIGTFNDLMQVDQFINVKDPSFTRLVSCFKSDLDYQGGTDEAQLIIFRESVSYLRHQHNYSHGSKILLMDFSDRDLDMVIESYNQRYYDRADNLSFDLTKCIENVMFSAYLEVE